MPASVSILKKRAKAEVRVGRSPLRSAWCQATLLAIANIPDISQWEV